MNGRRDGHKKLNPLNVDCPLHCCCPHLGHSLQSSQHLGQSHTQLSPSRDRRHVSFSQLPNLQTFLHQSLVDCVSNFVDITKESFLFVHTSGESTWPGYRGLYPRRSIDAGVDYSFHKRYRPLPPLSTCLRPGDTWRTPIGANTHPRWRFYILVLPAPAFAPTKDLDRLEPPAVTYGLI